MGLAIFLLIIALLTIAHLLFSRWKRLWPPAQSLFVVLCAVNAIAFAPNNKTFLIVLLVALYSMIFVLIHKRLEKQQMLEMVSGLSVFILGMSFVLDNKNSYEEQILMTIILASTVFLGILTYALLPKKRLPNTEPTADDNIECNKK